MTEHLPDELLNEYLDGYLSASQTDDVETHLATCATCAARADSLRALFTTLDDLPDLPLNKDFSKSVLRAIRPEVVLPRPWKWAVWGQLALAALLLALTLPTLSQNDWLSRLIQTPDFPAPLTQLGLFFEQFTEAITQTAIQVQKGLQAFQTPNLPVSLSVLLPILLATGLLWLVGNGLLLKERP
ncbi:MAG TPA: zf-HC2 domain-containing protein [Anaerolineales bacterium]|nr:zf-HC2 domain-containing protein [Anaerolineales bacterium]